MSKTQKIIGIILIIALIAIVRISKTNGSSSDATVNLAKCLTEKGAIFYGTERCPHCQAQKALFGAAMDKVNYIDCDKQADKCQAASIQGYPTWVFADGSRGEGTQPLHDLALKTACEYNPGTGS